MTFNRIEQFVARSIGRWRSQRSAHHLAFAHFEAVRSNIEIEALSADDPRVVELCQNNKTDLEGIAAPFFMSWSGESDWDDDDDDPETLSGSTVLVPVPDPNDISRGQLLRDRGYAETVAAIGDYQISEDGIFTLLTSYDRAAAAEKIWFETPNLRFRISTIRTSSGKGVTTASFSSEIRLG
ncbi:MAG: phycobiliprotein lyase [Cyanobacteria bacterium P01_E01_bin.48]